jgi:hypothetical protein
MKTQNENENEINVFIQTLVKKSKEGKVTSNVVLEILEDKLK